MRRSLVLGDAAARHPFLQQLPRHVRHGGGKDPLARRHRRFRPEDDDTGLRQRLGRWRKRSGLTAQDVRDFLLAYCACFVAITAFIA